MDRLRILFSHWQIVVMALGFAAGLVTVLAGPRWLLALVPLGIAAQMLNEYAMHRFLFHWPPPRRQWQFDLLWQAHYGHHDFPTNHRLFFVPWWVALPTLAVHVAAVALIGGWLAPGHGLQVAAAVTLTGGVGTFLAYEWFHMTAHLPVAKTAEAVEKLPWARLRSSFVRAALAVHQVVLVAAAVREGGMLNS